MKNEPIISEIAAVCKNNGIGKDNDLLFKIPDDLKHFKEITDGHAVIMGYNTYLSLGKPLPNRVNIVLSPAQDLKIGGCVVVNSIDNAISEAKKIEANEIFIIGGASIYGQFLPYASKLYLTLIDAEPEADTFFPDYSEFSPVAETGSGSYNGIGYKFVTLEKK
jgi:dihydrofolate reductase